MNLVKLVVNSFLTSFSIAALVIGCSIVWTKGPAAISTLMKPASLQTVDGSQDPYNTHDILKNSSNKSNYIVRLQNLEGGFFCSGFVISDIYVITAAHCLVDFTGRMKSEKFWVVSSDEQRMETATTIGVENTSDLALVKGNFRDFNKARILTNANELFPLSKNYKVCGFPLGVKEITCYPTDITSNKFFQLRGTGMLIRGQSGGPVIDIDKDLVVALNTAVDDPGIILSPLVGIFSLFGVVIQ